ncbi:GNAT family N-acetyltransferase [Paenibacillus sp. KS-LC4]|uniref:GNAT family N-acetyltransferase n=1 Tax=Paenibacillus sp. KS-LC4 TaxID=2979727 RepID=UPI0030D55A88
MIRERNARTDDEEIIRLIKTELMPLSWTTHQHDATVIRELPLRLRRGVTYVAAAGKTAVPYGFIHFETMGDILMFSMLAVHPQHRNRHCGTKLMAAAEAHGLAASCTMGRLFVDQINDKARYFYTKLGYQTIRYYPELRCYEMIKGLA